MSQRATLTSPISTMTSTSGPITVAERAVRDDADPRQKSFLRRPGQLGHPGPTGTAIIPAFFTAS